MSEPMGRHGCRMGHIEVGGEAWQNCAILGCRSIGWDEWMIRGDERRIRAVSEVWNFELLVGFG